MLKRETLLSLSPVELRATRTGSPKLNVPAGLAIAFLKYASLPSGLFRFRVSFFLSTKIQSQTQRMPVYKSKKKKNNEINRIATNQENSNK